MPEASACYLRCRLWYGTPPLRADVDYPRQGILAEDGRGTWDDLDPIDILQGNQVIVDLVEVGLIHSYAIHQDCDTGRGSPIEPSKVNRRLKAVPDFIEQHDPRLQREDLLNGCRSRSLDLLCGDHSNVSRNARLVEPPIRQARRADHY